MKESPAEYNRAIKDLDSQDRPREKAIRKGFSSLSTAELLAIIIGSGSPGESVVDLCQRIMHDNGDKLYRLARRSIKELTKAYVGIGEVKAVTILAALELARRNEIENFEEMPQVTSSDVAYAYLKPRMAHLAHEQICLLLLDRAKRITDFCIISQGGTAASIGDLKVILRTVLEKGADSFILAHNHPSDSIRPSRQDDDLTHRVAIGAKSIDVPLIDHIIVSRNGHYSYHEENKL